MTLYVDLYKTYLLLLLLLLLFFVQEVHFLLPGLPYPPFLFRSFVHTSPLWICRTRVLCPNAVGRCPSEEGMIKLLEERNIKLQKTEVAADAVKSITPVLQVRASARPCSSHHPPYHPPYHPTYRHFMTDTIHKEKRHCVGGSAPPRCSCDTACVLRTMTRPRPRPVEDSSCRTHALAHPGPRTFASTPTVLVALPPSLASSVRALSNLSSLMRSPAPSFALPTLNSLSLSSFPRCSRCARPTPTSSIWPRSASLPTCGPSSFRATRTSSMSQRCPPTSSPPVWACPTPPRSSSRRRRPKK